MTDSSLNKSHDIDGLFTQEALKAPCASDDHPPFYVNTARFGEPTGVYGWVRTDSYHRDGGGGRTDLHDVWSVLLAVVFRAVGISSVRLIDYVGWGGPPELYGRVVLFEQSLDPLVQGAHSEDTARKLKAQVGLAYHVIADVINDQNPRVAPPSWDEETEPPWLAGVRKLLPAKNKRDIWITRSNPDWQYFSSEDNAVSVTVLPRGACVQLRGLFIDYKPSGLKRGKKTVLGVKGLFNVISETVIRLGVKLLRCVEGESTPPWVGPFAAAFEYAILVVPTESHCMFLGKDTVVTVRAECGRSEYLKQRAVWAEQSAREAEIFNFSTECEWSSKIDPGRFEALTYSLLAQEPGIDNVRSVGATRDRDQGRDLIARWMTPPQAGQRRAKQDEENPFQLRDIVVQCKTRNRTIGKADVRDVRDTLDRHAAQGFLLVAYPRVSNDLSNYIVSLRNQGYWTDYWTQQELEDRLRRHPHIVNLFSDLVRLVPRR